MIGGYIGQSIGGVFVESGVNTPVAVDAVFSVAALSSRNAGKQVTPSLGLSAVLSRGNAKIVSIIFESAVDAAKAVAFAVSTSFTATSSVALVKDTLQVITASFAAAAGLSKGVSKRITPLLSALVVLFRSFWTEQTESAEQWTNAAESSEAWTERSQQDEDWT